MRTAEIMTAPAVTASPHSTIADATGLVVQHRIGALPVVDDHGRLVGIVSEFDLFRAQALARGYGLGGTVIVEPHECPHFVADVMHRQVLWVDAHDNLELCVQMMMRHQGRSLPVLRAGVVVGMITRRDVLAAISQREVPVIAAAGPGSVGDPWRIDLRECTYVAHDA